MNLIRCTICRIRLDGDYGDYYIVGASEFPACSYECVIELPGFEYNIDKMIDGKKGPLDKDNYVDSIILTAIKLIK